MGWGGLDPQYHRSLKRVGISSLLVLVGVASWAALGTPPVQGSQKHSKSSLLSGPTKIRKLEVLRLTRGPHRGSLLVWADVSHGPLAAGQVPPPGATHTGRLNVRVRGSAGTASGRDTNGLDIASSQVQRLAHGYRVRIPQAEVAALTGGGSSRIQVSVRAAQKLDLDGDGSAEASRSDSASRSIKPAAVGATINPKPGRYLYSPSESTDSFFLNVAGGDVNGFNAVEFDGQCFVFGNGTPAPVDPATGSFSYTVPAISGPQGPPQVSIQGQYLPVNTVFYVAHGAVTALFVDDPQKPCPTIQLGNTSWGFV